MNRKLAILALLHLQMASCHLVQDEDRQVMEDHTVDLPGDFLAFYDRFHADSLYQLEHIVFPLSGVPTGADAWPDDQKFTWERDDWKMHRSMAELSGYKKVLSVWNGDIVIEDITQEAVAIGMQRRFARMDGEWMLIYYAAMNPLISGEYLSE